MSSASGLQMVLGALEGLTELPGGLQLLPGGVEWQLASSLAI